MKEDWIECKLDDIVSSFKRGPFGGDLKKSFFVKEGYAVYEQQHAINNDFSTIRYFIDEDRFKKLEACEVKSGDYIISCSGTMGKIARLPENSLKGIINQALLKISLNDKLMTHEYFVNYFRSKAFQNLILGDSRGSGIQNISGIKEIKVIPVSLPPLPIQRAIVAKIEALFSDLDNGIANFKKAQEQLKIYRQAVLKKAFEGGFSINNDELGITNKEGSINHTNQTKSESNDLPIGWEWVKLGEVGKVKGGKRLPPKHSYSEKNTDYLYIMAGNLKDGTVKYKQTYINKETFDILSNYKVKGGEVYITIVGACIGDAGIIPKNIGNAILTENAAKIIDLNSIDNKYLALWLNSIDCQTEIKNNILSATLGKLALSRISTLSVPLPPTIEEQTQIVQEIERRLSVCENLEFVIRNSIEKAEALRQSILKKAFEGKLLTEAEIEQCKKEADYEPASELLKKITNEKLRMTNEKKAKKVKIRN
jgi:type I restriction enzyme S subunit